MTMRYLFPALLLAIAACETTPTAPAAPTEMAAASFDELYARAEANPSAASVDLMLTQLLASPELSRDQRAKVLLLRAERRRMGNYNLPGAIEDYTEFTSLVPNDPNAANALQMQTFAQNSVSAAQSRMAYLQNLTNWFDDMVLMGRIDEGAKRYERSGLMPTDLQVYTLKEAGFLCQGSDPVKALHKFGDKPAYATGLVWCERAVS